MDSLARLTGSHNSAPPTIGDVLNAICEPLESIGLEIDAFDADSFRIVGAGGRFVGEFHTRPANRPPADNFDDGEDDEVVPYDDPRWDDNDSWTTDDDVAKRRAERDRATTLTPEEQEWKESLKPFSRNFAAPPVEVLRRTLVTLDAFDAARRQS